MLALSLALRPTLTLPFRLGSGGDGFSFVVRLSPAASSLKSIIFSWSFLCLLEVFWLEFWCKSLKIHIQRHAILSNIWNEDKKQFPTGSPTNCVARQWVLFLFCIRGVVGVESYASCALSLSLSLAGVKQIKRKSTWKLDRQTDSLRPVAPAETATATATCCWSAAKVAGLTKAASVKVYHTIFKLHAHKQKPLSAGATSCCLWQLFFLFF